MRFPRSGRVIAAWWIAITADALQIVLFPLLLGAPAYAAADSIDAIVCVLLVWLLGWHLAFLPTFVSELVPFLDLIPTWTAAVWFVTRRRAGPAPSRPAPPRSSPSSPTDPPSPMP